MPFVKNIMCQDFNEFFKYRIKFKFNNIYIYINNGVYKIKSFDN